MKVPRQFAEDFKAVTTFWKFTEDEIAEAKAHLTPETLPDAIECFRALANELTAEGAREYSRERRVTERDPGTTT